MGGISPLNSATAWAAKSSLKVRAKQLNEDFIAGLDEQVEEQTRAPQAALRHASPPGPHPAHGSLNVVW